MSISDDLQQQLNDERHEAVMRRLAEIHTDVRLQNSRVGKSEIAIAALQQQMPANLQGRLSTIEERNPGKQGGLWGALGGLVAGFVSGWMRP